MKRMRSSSLLALALLLLFAWAVPLLAQDPGAPAPSAADLQKELDATRAELATKSSDFKGMADTTWVIITGMLVFFMNLGFACVESGFCRPKNAVNILSKNFIVFAATSIGFWALGWGIMYGDGNDWFGYKGMAMVSGQDNSPSTSSLGTLVKSDIKAKYELDLADAEVAKANEPVAKAVDDEVEKATAALDTPEKTYKVSVAIPGKGTFEKEYTGKDAYIGAYSALNWTGVPLWAKFFFQLVFAGTAATIVSGAVAERIKYGSFIVFSFVMAIAIYPVVGHWIWGGGLLAPGHLFGDGKGMFDFAGSTVVHSVGGWAALMGALILGPRIGKFGADGKINAIPGHNLTAATIGCFVLWFGWFGFNPGSTMAADPGAIARICITTNSAAVAATLTATITAWLLLGKPDLGMTLNGCLAGLVAITAPCAFVSVEASLIIGALAGVIVVFAVLMFDRIRIDDPVGATSVHLVNGVFGTLCVGLFGQKQLIISGQTVTTGLPNNGLLIDGSMDQFLPQLIGVLVVAAYVVPVAGIAWLVLKYTIGIRVTAEEEVEGLDIGEHGNEAYHGFVMAAAGDVMAGTEPRAAIVPPGGEKRFTVVVDGVDNGDLLDTWSEICMPSGASPDLKAVYPYVTTVQGNRFRFRGGDPDKLTGHLQSLLKERMKKPVRVRVE